MPRNHRPTDAPDPEHPSHRRRPRRRGHPDGPSDQPDQLQGHIHGHLHGHAHGHVHGHGGDGEAGSAKAKDSKTLLLAFVLPVAILAVFGMILLWPDGNGPQDSAYDTTYGDPGSTIVTGTIASLKVEECTTPHPVNGRLGSGGLTCVRSKVELTSGPNVGERVSVELPPASDRAGATEGDKVRLLHATIPDNVSGDSEYYAFVDFVRSVPMGWLAAVYAIVVVAVARLRGLRALIGLALGFTVIGVFMLPALLEGKPAVLVGVVGAAAIMLVVLYFTHGLSSRTTTALLGTLGGLAVTAAIASWAVSSSRLTGSTGHEGEILQLSIGSLNMSSVLLCGIILAGLGVLNDVTITQASAVWELHALSPQMQSRQLFAGAMRIGRDHIASTVYTIAFAYVGAALPVLLLLEVYQRPLGTAITSGELAEEVIRTLAGSIGLVLAIPLTTVIAVAVVKATDRATGSHPPVVDPDPHPDPDGAIVAGVIPADVGESVDRRAPRTVEPRPPGFE